MNKKGLKLDIIQNNDRLCHQVQRKKINHPPTDLLFQSFVQVFCKDFILEISYFNIDSICCAEISIDSKRIVLVLQPNTSIKVDTSLAGRELKFSKNKGFIQCIFWRPLAVGNDLIPDDSLPAFAIVRVYYKCGDGSKRLTMTSEFDEMGYLDDGTKRGKENIEANGNVAKKIKLSGLRTELASDMGGDYSDEMMVDESLRNDEILNLDSSSMIERVVEATPSNQVQENQSLKSTFKDIDETEPPLILNSFASCSTNLQHSASVIMQPVFYRRRIPIELNDKMYRFTVDIDTKKYQLENSIRKKFGNIVMVGYVESLQYTWNEIDDSTLKRLDRVLLVQQK